MVGVLKIDGGKKCLLPPGFPREIRGKWLVADVGRAGEPEINSFSQWHVYMCEHMCTHTHTNSQQIPVIIHLIRYTGTKGSLRNL